MYSYLPTLVLILVSGPFIVNSSTPSSSSCNEKFNYNQAYPISVLVISSGSTGRICIQYSNSLHNSGSSISYISIYQYNSTGQYGVCPACSLNEVTSLFTLTASPDTVMFSSGNGSTVQRETVTYTISVPSSIRSGIFGIFIFQFCSLFPMAVIPTNGANVLLTSSEFSSWYPHTGSCPAQYLTANLLGVDGFQLVSLWSGFAIVGPTTGPGTQSEISTQSPN